MPKNTQTLNLDPKTKVAHLSAEDLNALSRELGEFGCSLHAAGPRLWIQHRDAQKREDGQILLAKNKTVFDVRGMASVIHHRLRQ